MNKAMNRVSDSLLSLSISVNNSKKKQIIALFGLSVFVIFIQGLSLLSPIQMHHSCGPTLTYFSIFHVHILCDSYWYVMDATHPTRLLHGGTSLDASNTLIQDRPLITFLAFIFSRLIMLIPGLHHQIVYKGEDGRPVTYELSVFLAYEVIYLIVIMALIYLCFSILRTELPNQEIPKNLITFGVFLAFISCLNQISKIFFWAPNAGLFNTFVPIYMVWIITKKNSFHDIKFQLVQGTLLSLATLLYPMFIICIPVFAILALSKNRSVAPFSIIISIISFISWPLAVNLVGGNYLNHPAKNFHEFTWILDAFQTNSPLSILKGKFHELILTIPIIPIFGIGIGVFILIISGEKKLRDYLRLAHLRSIGFEIFGLLFYVSWIFLIGIYDVRFTWGPVLYVIAVIIRSIFRRDLNCSVWLNAFIFTTTLLIFYSWIFTASAPT